MFSYLKTVHPDEWDNFVERLGIRDEVNRAGGNIPESVWSDPDKALEVQLWASLRGQTLARVICGVMQFEEALLMFAKQEQEEAGIAADTPVDSGPIWQADPLFVRRAHLKYGYVISCQVYGNWKDDNNLKKGVDALLRRFPHLRIAYV
eukprot:COSAG01_NODE_7479_length_3193_cov_1.911441_2_plen_148_part_01